MQRTPRSSTVASDPLTITFVDAAYLPLLRIWLPRLRELGVTRLRVFCLDQGRTGEYQLPFRDRLVQCWSQPVQARTTAGPLSVALLPQREFQRLPEQSTAAVVKHYLTPKSCPQKLQVLRDYGLI
jgi:hypothetical protein